MTTSSVHTLLPKIVPLIAGCNDDLAKIILADAARTFAREADIVIETRGFPETEAPEYGRMPEFAVDKDHFVPLHFISRNEDKVNKRVYLTYSLLPTADLMPESVIIRHYEAITSQALFQLYSMPGKPWTSADMAQLYLQKYRIALGDAMRDNNTGGAVFDQFMICCEPGEAGFIGAQNITATVIGTDTSDGNITPDVVLAGYKGYAKGEMVVGNIQMMPEPSVADNVITVYAGLNQTEKTVEVPEAGALTVIKNKVTVPVGYVKSERTAEIPVKSATLTANTVTIPEGYHNDQTLSVPVVSAVNDGEYVTIPVGYINSEQKFKISGNTGVNVDFVTAEAGDILAGKTGTDKSGNPVYGTIQTVTPSKSGNVVTIPKGYIATAQTLTIDTAKTATVSGNVVTIYPGYTASQYTATVPKATSSVSGNVVTIPAGYHDATTKTVAEMAEPTVSANVVTIPVGYNKVQKTKTITEAGQTTVSGNVVTTPVGYVKTERKNTVGTAKGAETITPGTADKTIAAGTYLTGALTVKGDADLISENIAEGKEIFGVAGSFKGGSSMEFFKCAAVYGPRQALCVTVSGCPNAAVNGNYLPTDFNIEDWEGNKYTVYSNDTYYYYYNGTDMQWCIGTDYNSYSFLYFSWGSGMASTSWNDPNWEPVEGMVSSESEVTVDTDVPKTWDGYKAVLSNGVYSFENEVTTGIPYTETAPKLYGIYSRDLAVQVDWLDDGNFWSRDLAFYAALEDSITRAETGQELKPAGSDVVNTVKDGVKCAFFEGQSGIAITDTDKFPQGSVPTTIFMNICPTRAGYSNAIGYTGTNSQGPRVYINDSYGTPQLRLGWCGATRDNFNYNLLNKWATMVLTTDAKGNVAVYYGKNVMISEADKNYPASYVAAAIGSGDSTGRSEVFKGYINQFRVYKRSFTYDEVCNYIDTYGFAGPFSIPAERQKIMYWNMNDTGSEAVDSINGIVLTKYNNVTPGASGISGTCWELPADSSGYLAGKNEKVSLPQKFTLHFAVNIAEAHSGTCGLVEFGSYDYTSGFGVWYDGSNLAPRMSRNYNNFRTPITKGAWHWVSFTYDGQNMKLYVDGVLTQTTPHKLLVTFDTSVKMFVRGDYTDSYQAHCKLDEVSLYNYAMTDEEISELVK